MRKPGPPTARNLPFEIRGAKIIAGVGRGRKMMIPTLNVEFKSLTKGLEYGIYACWVRFDGRILMGAMHFGPRPVFKDTVSMEIHVLDAALEKAPEKVDILISAFIRDILDLPNPEDLKSAIRKDIDQVRAILKQHDPDFEKAGR